ncbi:MAG: hypothetical protein K2G69_08355, partial [Muribaculaceae bacterium]|nr:hypothetical protein [Muribaculaceae bacterium]
MSEIKITDLVPKETIDELVNLRQEMQATVDKYTEVAAELAKGLTIPVKGVGDLERREKLVATTTQQATSAQSQLIEVSERQNRTIANTTNTLSRQLMEQERLNKQNREAYRDGEKVREMVERIGESYENQTRVLAKYDMEIKANKKAQSDLEKQYKSGLISEGKYIESQAKLIAESRKLAVEKSNLTQVMKIQEKLASDNAGSYSQLSHQLELLKNQYKQMDDQMRESDVGKEFERTIQDLDAHLKDMAADMGEFQRNVGNYAIAGQNGIVATESLNAAIAKTPQTMQDVVDQTKILEEARMMLDQKDEHYAETLAALDAQLEENRKKLTSVDDILGKEAKTVAEAEMQNKRLKEALRHIDLTADDAQATIDRYNRQIQENNELIEDNCQWMNRQEEMCRNVTGTIFDMVDMNGSLGQSFIELGENGNVIEGIEKKTKAFGKTLLGLLKNPYMLVFLGIAAVAAGFKWWYDYNKGLIEATKLTKNFTGETGDAMKHTRSEIQAMADTMGHGFDETIGSANVLVQQFGISWEEAMRIMKDGYVAGADMSGEMLNNINSYAPAFKDAGIGAEQFMAIITNTKNGIFDESGLKAITDAGMRLRNMSKKACEALDAIGISSEQMKKDLNDGNITMLEGIQQITDKLKELPPNAQEVGAVLNNVFGKKSAKAGEELIESISDIDDNLQKLKEEMGEVGEITDKQMKAQAELNETLADIFDQTGGSFETMIGNAKLFITEGLTKILRKGVEVYNWVVDLYNTSVTFRGNIQTVILAVKNGFTAIKGLINLVVNAFKTVIKLGVGLQKILTGDLSEGLAMMKDAVVNYVQGLGKTFYNAGQEIGKNIADGINNAANSRLKPIELKIGKSEATGARKGVEMHDAEGIDTSDDDKKKSTKEKVDEQLKLLAALEESKLALMKDGHEKEMLTIQLNFKKKIDAIKGDSETERQTRVNLLLQMQNELDKCERKYQEEIAKINLANRLAAVKEGSREELNLKLAQLEQNRKKEVEEAEKTGADVLLVEEKYEMERLKLKEEYASKQAELLMGKYTVSQMRHSDDYTKALANLNEEYAERMKLAKGNVERMEQIQRDYDERMYKLGVYYAKMEAEEAIKMLEKITEMEGLSAEERERYERELASAKRSYELQMAADQKESVDRQIAEDERLRQARMSNIQKWLDVAQQAISAISDLANALFDSQIQSIENLQEANEEAGEKEADRITELVEKKVITEEEGEARKRAAEAKTAKKNEELEKKKAELLRKQAVFQKATDLAQAGIATALAI